MKRCCPWLLIPAACISISFAYAGGVQKCTAPDGKVTYSDVPCVATASAARIDVSHAAPGADQERAIAKLRNDLAADADAQRRAESRAQQAARDAAFADAMAYRPPAPEPVVIDRPYPVYYPGYGCGLYGCGSASPKRNVNITINNPPAPVAKPTAAVPATIAPPRKQ